MFEYCTDPSAIDGLNWLACYLTTGKHMLFYKSFFVVLSLLAVTAPAALALGFAGAMASRARLAPIRWIGALYTSMVRGVPDIIFFLFVPFAMDQGFEWLRHKVKCPDWSEPIRQGNDFIVCSAAKLPLNSAPQSVHELYGFTLAVLAFAIVFGAFAANVMAGAMKAVPHAQIETAESYGMSHRQSFWRILVPQMWIFALPGLSNLWMILIKATPLLFLLGVEDIVYWARELGGTKTSQYTYPHPDWRLWYFLALLVFYLCFTRVSEIVLGRITRKLSHGQATVAGEEMRKAA
ncbi:ABC transporter permease [Celeribacter marinus]|uniref:ABC transporter, permease protein, HisMQ family n=1 Tax=Celeribacter marinus TaxID=1397108 RepID=A0A0P0ADY4_9RHOB|nr:ABC transporter permease subunit [Celeribacter marinus]ALI56459.1 ABC transporter, permease protein, HisMQ family [Celeribacter marinus]SFK42628.1 amino acid ABC transporter membrane protein 1, PAAT family [Celeribacter marinus]